MELGIITDEVADDLEVACRHISEWGLTFVELRMLWGRNVVELDEADVLRALALMRRHDLRVTAIASPVFKSPLDEQPRAQRADFALEGVDSMEAQLELLDRACALANRFDAPMVRVFTFWREDWTDAVTADLVAKLRQAAEVARRHDVVLAIENEPVCLVGTGHELGRLCTALVDALPPELVPHLGALWDPGNALAAGEDPPYPDGYEALNGLRLAHVHLKDLRFDEAGHPVFVPLGEGRVDYAAQLTRLHADGYDGKLVLEPHYRPAGKTREEAAHACVVATQRLLAELDAPTRA